MTTPESICCSLETSIKLKEAGFNKETVFVWVEQCGEMLKTYPKLQLASKPHSILPVKVYPAPTSSEIELPEKTGPGGSWLTLQKVGQWECGYEDSDGQTNGPTLEAPAEVEAKAEMWLYLKMKGLI